jgi:hypothetical protein
MLKRRTKSPPGQCVGANVFLLRQRLLAHHRTVLNRWLAAGRRMGLCDASVCLAGPGQSEPDHVVVWVRENPDPAYIITADGMSWRVTDCIRGETLARHASFEAALHFIRPVLEAFEAA